MLKSSHAIWDEIRGQWIFIWVSILQIVKCYIQTYTFKWIAVPFEQLVNEIFGINNYSMNISYSNSLSVEGQ